MMYKRVPPVFSFEYLRVFLDAIEKGGYDRKAIRSAIFDERLKFEKEKFKAIGKGYRLKTVKSERLVKNCHLLSTQIGLLRRTNGDVLPSEESREFLRHEVTYPKTKSMLLSRLLKTYIPFNEVLSCLRNQDKDEILLPLGKETVPFKSFAERYQLKVDKIQFQVVRDLLTQLEILNWREKKNGERMQKVYLIADVLKLSDISGFIDKRSKSAEIENLPISRFLGEFSDEGGFTSEGKLPTDIVKQAENKGYISTRLGEDEDFLLIRTFTVGIEDFERVLWKEYLKLSDYKSNYPVYYSELRDCICEQLRISDRTFDGFIKRMINLPEEYTVKLHPGGGPMPPRRGLSSMLKVLPPKTGSDEYITFIKATR